MSTTDIAIVGMACRFPMANSVDEFWRNLCQSKECLTRFNHEELVLAGIPLTDIQNPDYVPVKGILANIDLFDSDFFQINPADANIIDPQQRIFLECAWEALEHSANIPSKKSDSVISVFTGIAESCYLQQNLLKNREFCQRYNWMQSRIAAGASTLSTQLSYHFNLRGKSINLNTACSTGLVAVICACQELLSGRSDLALAGSVSMELPQTKGYLYKTTGIDSRDGHCRPFAHNANGTVFSNGVGAVVLKRLNDAVADRDTIYAVIKGYGINNDGSKKLNYYAPSIDGQATCIHAALTEAEISAADVGFIEAHGTATELGDFIEVTALNKVFRQFTQRKQYCVLGSVKGNIGHTDLSAGIASLIKAILCAYHQAIPATLHFEKPNLKIRYEDSPFYVNSQLIHWSAKDNPYIGVSAFGIGGTNSHIILTRHSSPNSPDSQLSAHSDQLIILSAKSETALQKSAINLQDYLRQKNRDSAPIDLTDIAYTLQTGRDEFSWRSFSVVQDINKIIDDVGVIKSATVFTEKFPVVFMFPGQGNQYPYMAYSLYQKIPLFKQTINQCSQIMQNHLSIDVEKLLFSDLSESLLNQTIYTQIALFVVEYALAQLLIHYGVKPMALIGHSLGEYTAACLAGIFSLEDALFLISERGRIMEQTPIGKMLAISCSLDEFTDYQQFFTIELAVHNANNQCVAAGDVDEITQLMTYLKQQGKAYRLLNANHAFHTRFMEAAGDTFYTVVSKVQLNPPKLPIISNLTGSLLTSAEATDPHYWCQHLYHTVQFKKSLDVITAEENSFFIEVGPGQVLSQMLPPTISKTHTLPNAQKKGLDSHQFLTALGFAWQRGIKINWQALHPKGLPQHIALPTYSFDRQRYWIESDQRDDLLETHQKPTQPRFFRPTWIRDTPYVSEHIKVTDNERTWIVFKDQNGLCDEIISTLTTNQINFIIVDAGEAYQEVNEKHYRINPAEKSHYVSLFTALKGQITNIPMIVHSFSSDKEAVGFLSDKQINQQLQLGFYSVLYLAQAYLDTMGEQASLHCAVITQVSQQITKDDVVIPVNAMLSGICRGISQEHPLLRFQLIDINLNKPESNYLNLSNTILQYCVQNEWNNNDTIIAFRQGFQWKLDYTHIKFNQTKNRFRDQGVYLITGGLGGIALTLCEKIAETISQPVFVLLSRSDMPPFSQWEQILHDATQIQLHDKIKHLQRLQALGAILDIRSVDITQLQPLKSIIQETLQSYGKIDGVIHAAGYFDSGFMQNKSYDAMQATFLPKVHGTYHLAEALKNISLDFLVFCSSLSALIGLSGHMDYCSANACLDAFSASRLFSASFLVSINWNTWKEVGMLTKTSELNILSSLNIGNDISSQQGQRLFMQIMQNNYSQIAISNYQISEFKKFFFQKNYIIPYDLTPDHASSSNDTTTIELQLLSLWKKILGTTEISVEDDFFDNLSGHSLNALELLNTIHQKFQCSLALTDIYATRTIAKLSALIRAHWNYQADITATQLSIGKVGFPCIFLFPPVSGTLFCYNEMVSSWGIEFPVYGLQDQSIVTGQLLFNDLMAMAKAYCAKLQQIQSHGPYYFVGYSFGAMLAYEVSNLLTQQGEKIQLLAMIDGWAVFPPEHMHERSFKKILGQYHSALSPFLIDLAWKRMQLLVSHQPSKSNLDVILFKAEQISREFQPIDHPDNGWCQFTKGRIISHLISADHEAIINKKHSEDIIKYLGGIILESVN